MSGGAEEYVAGYISDNLGDSGFATSDTEMGSSYNKYFDRYSAPQNNYQDYNYRIYYFHLQYLLLHFQKDYYRNPK